MKITIDCRMFDASGVGVYLRGCLPFLVNSANQFLLLGSPEKLEPFFSACANVEIIDCKIKPFSLSELLFFSKKILEKINSSDVFFSPFFNVPRGIKIPVFPTIHDIIFPDMPELISRAGLAARMRFYRRAYKKSQGIFTVSNFSKSRIEHHLGKEKPVIVTYSAVLPMFMQYREKISSPRKNETIVFIGNIKKHKGLDILLDAFIAALAKGLKHKLVIIGSKENFRSADNAILQKIDALGSNSVIFTGFVSDEQLMEHISSAALLVQPSLYEGFCLPPLEALVLGTNVLMSDIPVLREIYGGFPVSFFKAGDAAALKNAMLELLSREVPPPVMTGNLLSKYSFEKTASIIFKELINFDNIQE